MNYPLIIRPEAELDMEAGIEWYEKQRSGLGIEFLIEVERVFDRIADNPVLYASEYRSIRRAKIKRFPYIVYYRLINQSVEVVAVQHGHRHPFRWQIRS